MIQPDQLQSYDLALNLAGQVSVPGITGVAVHGSRVFAHTGSQIEYFNLNPPNCSLAAAGHPVHQVPDLKSVAVHPAGQVMVELVTPGLTGPSRLLVHPLGENGLPAFTQEEVQLPGRAFGLAFNPEGTRLYVLGDLGVVSVITIDPDTPALSGTFQLLGADQLQFDPALPGANLRAAGTAGPSATAGSRLFYVDVSNPNRGRICMVALDAAGFPSAAPVCEANSSRPRPDSDFRILRPVVPAGAALRGRGAGPR